MRRSSGGTLFTAVIYGVWLDMEVSSAAPLCMPRRRRRRRPWMFAVPPVGYFTHESLLVLLFVHVWPLKSIWLLAPESEASDGKPAGNNEEPADRRERCSARPPAFNVSQQLVEKVALNLQRAENCVSRMVVRSSTPAGSSPEVSINNRKQETGGTLSSKHQTTCCCCCCCCCCQYGRRSQTTAISGLVMDQFQTFFLVEAGK